MVPMMVMTMTMPTAASTTTSELDMRKSNVLNNNNVHSISPSPSTRRFPRTPEQVAQLEHDERLRAAMRAHEQARMAELVREAHRRADQAVLSSRNNSICLPAHSSLLTVDTTGVAVNSVHNNSCEPPLSSSHSFSHSHSSYSRSCSPHAMLSPSISNVSTTRVSLPTDWTRHSSAQSDDGEQRQTSSSSTIPIPHAATSSTSTTAKSHHTLAQQHTIGLSTSPMVSPELLSSVTWWVQDPEYIEDDDAGMPSPRHDTASYIFESTSPLALFDYAEHIPVVASSSSSSSSALPAPPPVDLLLASLK